LLIRSYCFSFVEFLVSSILVEDQRDQVVYFGVEAVRWASWSSWYGQSVAVRIQEVVLVVVG